MPKLEAYNYHLPKELIAQAPVTPRDSARLFVYDTKTDTITFDTVRHMGTHLPQHSLLVFNDTKVLPARLFLKKETGGKIEVLLSLNELRPGDTTVSGIVDRKLVPPARLFFASGAYLDVVAQKEHQFVFKPSVPIASLPTLLMREGHTPIPPYIKNSPLSEHMLRKRYQSILAHDGTSVAAPTASLHFTKRVLGDLATRNIGHTEVTLHVGAGTFAPITEDNFKSKQLFTEYCSISPDSAGRINSALRNDYPVIPVGTTALRTIESFAKPIPPQLPRGPLESCIGNGEKGTNIFIFPPYEFQVAGGLITNFHVPKSSLMLLVDALLEHKQAKRRILDLYTIAIKEKFRFYSFGDAMLIV